MSKQVNVISRVLADANKDKTFVGLTVRLKKSGRFHRINGQVHDFKVSQDGQVYVIVENFFGSERSDGRKWQAVSLDNVLSVRKDKLVYRK